MQNFISGEDAAIQISCDIVICKQNWFCIVYIGKNIFFEKIMVFQDIWEENTEFQRIIILKNAHTYTYVYTMYCLGDTTIY